MSHPRFGRFPRSSPRPMFESRTTNPAVEDRGFTLIEMVVAMAIIGLVLAALAAIFSSMVRGSHAIIDGSALQTEARAAVDNLVTDVRQAYTADPSTPPIISMSANQLSFYTPDRQQPFHLLKVAYRLSGGNLQRAFETSTNTGGPPWKWPIPDTLGPWATVVGTITNTNLFAFQQADGSTAPDTSHVSRVLITISVAQPAQSGGATTTFQSSATIRGDQGSS